MPLWVIKYAPYGILAVLLVVGLWFVDHNGYKRAQTQDQLQTERDNNLRLQVKNWMQQQVSIFEREMQIKVNESDQKLAERIDAINVEERTIVQPTIQREIRNDPRLSDPNLGLSDSLWGALNVSRERGSHPCITSLTAAQRAPCPKTSKLTDKTIGTLATEDSMIAYQYARCREKDWAVVVLFDQLRAITLELIEKLKEKPDVGK
jgi:hypothetical protein